MKAHLVVWLLAATGCSLYFDDRRDPNADPPVRPDPPGQPPKGPPPHPIPPPALPPPSVDPLPLCGASEVNIFSIYETTSGRVAGEHPGGYATVTIDRPGAHTLVFASYEPTKWTVELAPGASIDQIFLFGYYRQYVEPTPAVANVPITTSTYEQSGGTAVCGYSLPYNGGGCDTDALLSQITQRTGGFNTFHGCYQASEFTLHADASTTSNCATAAGYQPSDVVQSCSIRDPGTGFTWMPLPFQTLEPALCTGERFVRYDERYNAWVGAILCGSTQRYKLYMAASPADPFLQIADYAGHGQDQCELVNTAFTLPDEDDITSGGCPTCAIGNLEDPIGVEVYARSVFGEPFERVVSREWADLTSTNLSCGVAIP